MKHRIACCAIYVSDFITLKRIKLPKNKLEFRIHKPFFTDHEIHFALKSMHINENLF